MTQSFIEHLETRLKDAPPKQKGMRTRERLKIATAKVLEQKGYHAMRVSDVTECAQVAEGSFYVYFRDKKDVSLTVLTSLFEEYFDIAGHAEGERSPFASIRRTNYRWLTLCRVNAGLMRCIFQLGDEEPDFARLSQRTNRLWYERVSKSITRRRAGLEERPALFAVYMLGAMMDELVRKLLVYPDPEFHALLADIGADDRVIADAASVIWLRVLYPDLRPPDDLPPVASALANWMVPHT
jgi:TetR/AcrR family transcriptional regulator, transcriptional repressor for nem operon